MKIILDEDVEDVEDIEEVEEVDEILKDRFDDYDYKDHLEDTIPDYIEPSVENIKNLYLLKQHLTLTNDINKVKKLIEDFRDKIVNLNSKLLEKTLQTNETEFSFEMLRYKRFIEMLQNK